MSRPRRLVSSLVAALFAIGLGLVAVVPFGWADLRVYDILMRWAGGGASSDRVAVVAIDDQSLRAFPVAVAT